MAYLRLSMQVTASRPIVPQLSVKYDDICIVMSGPQARINCSIGNNSSNRALYNTQRGPRRTRAFAYLSLRGTGELCGSLHVAGRRPSGLEHLVLRGVARPDLSDTHHRGFVIRRAGPVNRAQLCLPF